MGIGNTEVFRSASSRSIKSAFACHGDRKYEKKDEQHGRQYYLLG